MRAIILVLTFLLTESFFYNCLYAQQYIATDTFPTVNNHAFGTSQLSKDGLSIYAEADSETISDDMEEETTETSASVLYYATRKNLTDRFTNFQLVQFSSPGDYPLMQPSLTADEKTMVATMNQTNDWQQNDLYITSRKNTSSPFNQPKILTINDTNEADAYPWISADGLRLYYLANDKHMFCQRKTPDEDFGKPSVLNFAEKLKQKAAEEDNPATVSVWLRQNELELYFVLNNIIYKCTRKSITDKFAEPVAYFRFPEKYSDCFLSSLSFTPDMNEFYLFVSDGETEFAGIVCFRLKK